MMKGGNKDEKICAFFNTSKGCKNGNQCAFLHTTMEKEPCKFFNGTGCKYGEKCFYAHVKKEMPTDQKKLLETTSQENKEYYNQLQQQQQSSSTTKEVEKNIKNQLGL